MPGGYYNGYWPYLAEAFAAYVNEQERRPAGRGVRELRRRRRRRATTATASTRRCSAVTPPGRATGDQWRDGQLGGVREGARSWPGTTPGTTRRARSGRPDSLQPVNIANGKLPPALLFQATDDAATPYEGGVDGPPLLARLQPGRRAGRRQPRHHAERQHLPGQVPGGVSDRRQGAARRRRGRRGVRGAARPEAAEREGGDRLVAGRGAARTARLPRLNHRPRHGPSGALSDPWSTMDA